MRYTTAPSSPSSVPPFDLVGSVHCSPMGVCDIDGQGQGSAQRGDVGNPMALYRSRARGTSTSQLHGGITSAVRHSEPSIVEASASIKLATIPPDTRDALTPQLSVRKIQTEPNALALVISSQGLSKWTSN